MTSEERPHTSPPSRTRIHGCAILEGFPTVNESVEDILPSVCLPNMTVSCLSTDVTIVTKPFWWMVSAPIFKGQDGMSEGCHGIGSVLCVRTQLCCPSGNLGLLHYMNISIRPFCGSRLPQPPYIIWSRPCGGRNTTVRWQKHILG